MTVRTNPFLRVVPDRRGEAFHVVELRTNAEYHLPNPGMLALLGRAREPTDRERLETVAVEEFGLSPERAAGVVASMLDNEFLVEEGSAAAALAHDGEEWRADGWWPAFEYLVTIRDYPYYRAHDYESAMERVSERAEHGDVPSVYKRYDDRPRVELPPVEEASLPSVAAVLGEGCGDRRTALDAGTLSTLLYYAFGQTGSQELPGVGEFVLKTSPSGGGRHPVEAYVAVLDVEGIEAGLYHYSVEGHDLERLGGNATAEETLAATDHDRRPAAAVACTAVVERNTWKYRDPQAYRIPYHDLGHLVETLRCCCEAYGLAATFGTGFDGEALAAALSVDRLAEPLLGHALLGRASQEG